MLQPSHPSHSRRRRRLLTSARALICALLLAVIGSSRRVAGYDADEAPRPRSGAASDAQLPSSKHTAQQALAVEDVQFGSDAAGLLRGSSSKPQHQCALDISLVWSAQLDVGLFATGAAVHLHSDRNNGDGKELVIPGFHRELNLLDRDGHHVSGSPLQLPTSSYFHSSPLLFDFNGDGTKDLLWISVDGEVLLLNGDANADNTQLEEMWHLPKMKMQRDWHKNLDEELVRDENQQSNRAAPITADSDLAGSVLRGGGLRRRLLEADDQDTDAPVSVEEAEQQDLHHPLRVIQRAKALRLVTHLVRKRVENRRQQENRGATAAARGGAGGRRLLQADGVGAGLGGRRRRFGRGANPPAAPATGAPATPPAPAAIPPAGGDGNVGGVGGGSSPPPPPPSPAASPAAAAAAAAAAPNIPDSGRDNDDDEDEDGSNEQGNKDDHASDEPVPLNAAIGVPMPDAADAGGKPSLERRHGLTHNLHGEETDQERYERLYARSLELPDAPLEGEVAPSDQEGGGPGGGAWYDDPAAFGADGEESELGELRSGEWVAGSRPGGAGNPEVRSALDEILEDDPDWMANLARYASEEARLRDQPPAAAENDADEDTQERTYYSQVVQELADKHARIQADIAARQEARQQRPTAHTPQDDAALDALVQAEDPSLREDSIVLTGITSADEAAVRALHERRKAAREQKRRDEDVTSNVQRILGGDEAQPSAGELVNGAGVFAGGAADANAHLWDSVPEEGRESFNLFSDPTLGTGKRGGKGGRLSDLDAEVAWELAELDRLYPTTDARFVWVDAHVLASPVLVDLDNDGRPELLVPVSYFFDENDYAARPALRRRLGPHTDLKKYVAGALLVIDPFTHAVLWTEHLDQSTARTKRTAHLYASPSVVDLQADGDLDILVPTGMGFVYSFNARQRQLNRGWPVLLAELQAPLAVGDIDQDGRLEVVACDARGNVVALRPDGTELWSSLVSGYSLGGAALGDVDGDGMMDVSIGTLAGHLWVLSGKDGKVLPKFPLRTDGRVVAPLTLVSLFPEPSAADLLLAPATTARARKGMHLVFPSFDGHVYVVEGRSGCTIKLDIGEHAYAQVLADDVLGRGKIDLIVQTMSGNVFAFATESSVEAHPLRPAPAYAARQAGQAGLVREGYHGLSISAASRHALMDCSGQEVEVEYTIVDERSKLRLTLGAGDGGSSGRASSDASVPGPVPPRYEVSFFFAGSLVHQTVHLVPGVYRASLPTGSVPRYTTLEIRMLNEHGQLFTDETTAALNVHFYRVIKYMVVGPFILMASLLILLQPQQRALPR